MERESRLAKGAEVMNSYAGSRLHKGENVADFQEAFEVKKLPEILFISSYPPRECGIATYTRDLLQALREKFGETFSFRVAALEETDVTHSYPSEVKYSLPKVDADAWKEIVDKINSDDNLKLVFIQHEFGLYEGRYGENIISFLNAIDKPIISAFHTILPNPSEFRATLIQGIVSQSVKIVVMTQHSAGILEREYGISKNKLTIIPHGTHLISSFDHEQIKAKNNLGDRIVLSTFGLLGSNKSIETALAALPGIIKKFPTVLYLIIGKTHPAVLKEEGDRYRDFLVSEVARLGLQHHVRFINRFLSTEDLLEQLQLTDIYLFTSKDPDQAVSGTFAYAMSCGCPMVCTPIPPAMEFLDGAGKIFDFENADQLTEAVVEMLSDPVLLKNMRLNSLHKIRPTAWQNSALAHIDLIMNCLKEPPTKLVYSVPLISLEHLHRLTTDFGMIQFSAISIPDRKSGYTLDDNARALVVMIKHYELTKDVSDFPLIETYASFILFCQQPDGRFLNYVEIDKSFFDKNQDENLEDANGRAIWALGEFVSRQNLFSEELVLDAKSSIQKAISFIKKIQSPRAMAFSIKGLHYYNLIELDPAIEKLIAQMAHNLASKYSDVSDESWQWFEPYLTYGNALLPEAMLCAYKSTNIEIFKTIAEASFNFLLSLILKGTAIKTISNKGWLTKGKDSNSFGEQPVDVAYTMLALAQFYEVFKSVDYLDKMRISYDWFLGNNHLHQIIYNPTTGGCYDGLEEHFINLNQGAESTVSYLLSRLVIEKYGKEVSVADINYRLI